MTKFGDARRTLVTQKYKLKDEKDETKLLLLKILLVQNKSLKRAPELNRIYSALSKGRKCLKCNTEVEKYNVKSIMDDETDITLEDWTKGNKILKERLDLYIKSSKTYKKKEEELKIQQQQQKKLQSMEENYYLQEGEELILDQKVKNELENDKRKLEYLKVIKPEIQKEIEEATKEANEIRPKKEEASKKLAELRKKLDTEFDKLGGEKKIQKLMENLEDETFKDVAKKKLSEYQTLSKAVDEAYKVYKKIAQDVKEKENKIKVLETKLNKLKDENKLSDYSKDVKSIGDIEKNIQVLQDIDAVLKKYLQHFDIPIAPEKVDPTSSLGTLLDGLPTKEEIMQRKQTLPAAEDQLKEIASILDDRDKKALIYRMLKDSAKGKPEEEIKEMNKEIRGRKKVREHLDFLGFVLDGKAGSQSNGSSKSFKSPHSAGVWNMAYVQQDIDVNTLKSISAKVKTKSRFKNLRY